MGGSGISILITDCYQFVCCFSQTLLFHKKERGREAQGESVCEDDSTTSVDLEVPGLFVTV